MPKINVRQKGHSFERFIAKVFRHLGYDKAHRQLEFQINNAHGIDIAESGIYAIQCKKTKKYVPMNTIQEVKYKAGQIPMLIAAGDNEEPLVTIPLWAFIALEKSSLGVSASDIETVHKELKELKG